MGIPHVLNLLSEAQAITVTANSTNVIDTGADKVGDVGPVMLEINVDTAFTADGAATLAVAIQHGDAANALATVLTAAPIGKALLVPGKDPLLRIILPYGMKRYIGLSYIVATGPMTAGAISAKLVDQQR